MKTMMSSMDYVEEMTEAIRRSVREQKREIALRMLARPDLQPEWRRLQSATQALTAALAEAGAAQAAWDARVAPASWPDEEVVGPCVCGSWPGGWCLQCPWQPASPPPAAPGGPR